MLLHQAEARFELLLVERRSSALVHKLQSLGLKARFAEDLGLAQFERLAFKFDILELNTALKPSFLRRLFEEGCEELIYVDPDICFYAPPLALEEAWREYEVLLTPHALAPILDGERPSDIDFLRNGVFNLGFVALRKGPTAQAMLSWWENRCLGLGFNDVGFGTFVDQKWMDLAPAYFEGVGILRDKGCNVAYWNLHEREVTRLGEEYRVARQPLVFFHFSGLNPATPNVLSKHQTRHAIEAGTVLQGLVANYAKALQTAGLGQYQGLDYSFARLDDGQAITPLMRRALCCQGVNEVHPFAAQSAFQRELRRCGLHAGPAQPAGVRTANLHALGWKLRLADGMVRLLARLMRADRMAQLLRYAALLSREAHLASVLLRRPLRMDHLPRE
ncbi:group 1 glycosyl transferase [Inhella inkyongensis]|uniref:group 1 glycosyl transferase n=1 Tax=Inhella inkyongensis TaxID=392593 RepID=UPI00110F2D37|nr:group 1 glycosyl transferase [Inhella inkyongensis]